MAADLEPQRRFRAHGGAVNTYGPFWLRATQVMGGRMFKLGAQVDF